MKLTKNKIISKKKMKLNHKDISRQIFLGILSIILQFFLKKN